MNLFRSMQAFVVTAQSGSMSAAAAALGQSPAMIGQHVAALEARLGTKLLNRTTRRQSLTDFGLDYVEQCRDILDRVALAEEAAEMQQTEARGRLRVTAPTTFGAEALMPALAGYRAEAPEVEIDITLTDRNVDLVEDGFDVAFRVGPVSDGGMVARALAPYRMAVCAAPDYLARHGSPGHPSDLARFEAIAFTPSARSPWRFGRGDEVVEVAPASSLTVNSGPAVRAAAVAGMGIVLQPEISLQREIEAGRLVRLFPDWRLAERPMSLVYYRDRQMTPRLRRFITFAVAAFGPAQAEPGA